MGKRRINSGVFLLVFGLLALLRMLGNPRVETLRVVDILGLTAPGLCFGFGLALLLRKVMFREE